MQQSLRRTPEIAGRYAAIPEAAAVALVGPHTNGAAGRSDIDRYVKHPAYPAAIPLAARAAVAAGRLIDALDARLMAADVTAP